METVDDSSRAAANARIDELERTIRELKLRIQRLERLLAPRAENPKDQAVVQTKVVYDWQK